MPLSGSDRRCGGSHELNCNQNCNRCANEITLQPSNCRSDMWGGWDSNPGPADYESSPPATCPIPCDLGGHEFARSSMCRSGHAVGMIMLDAGELGCSYTKTASGSLLRVRMIRSCCCRAPPGQLSQPRLGLAKVHGTSVAALVLVRSIDVRALRSDLRPYCTG